MKANIRLGDVLLESGYISSDQLNLAITFQQTNKSKRLGEVLLEMGFISETQLLEALGKRLNVEIIDLKTTNVNLKVVELVPKSVSMKHYMLPIDKKGTSVVLALNDPLDFYGIEDMKSFFDGDAIVVLCHKEALTQMIRQSYAEIDARLAASSAGEDARIYQHNEIMDIDIELGGQDSPIIKLVNTLLLKAYSEGVSDIHIEPFDDMLQIRFRSDGQLVPYMELDPALAMQLATRVKILAELDIAERRMPQDGNFKVQVAGKDVGIRVSTMPSPFGEKIVLRFLSQQIKLDNDQTYGMSQKNYDLLQKILLNPHGIVYITGPTGSGKTTTLYMVLEQMQKKPINISTIEDPIERNIKGVTQVQVNPKAGLTFSSGLRSMLRQDPDVILVGETRDSETAQIAVSAAITGHLVLSTLHTNDAISSIVRLSDMGVKSYLLANSLAGVVAQRLVKKICPFCKEEYVPTDQQKTMFPDVEHFYHGSGCSACNQTGYKGRIAVHEVLEIDKIMRSMISHEESTEKLYDYIKETGKMNFIKEDIYELVVEGVTSIDEYQKHTAFDI